MWGPFFSDSNLLSYFFLLFLLSSSSRLSSASSPLLVPISSLLVFSHRPVPIMLKLRWCVCSSSNSGTAAGGVELKLRAALQDLAARDWCSGAPFLSSMPAHTRLKTDRCICIAFFRCFVLLALWGLDLWFVCVEEMNRWRGAHPARRQACRQQDALAACSV